MHTHSMHALALRETAAAKSCGSVQTRPLGGVSFADVLQTVSQTEESFANLWRDAYGKYFPQGAGQWFYHVMDVSGISDADWEHNDFPFDRLMREEPDASVVSWRPSRANPSQLDGMVQAKTQATLGKHAIFVPPELDEKMKNDPALARKVANAVERVYSFHRSKPFLPMPGTKFYGTKTYGSVIVLNAEGEVEHACVTSGGGIIGPDEHTLRQIEREQAKKRARREAAHRLAVEASEKHWRMVEDLRFCVARGISIR